MSVPRSCPIPSSISSSLAKFHTTCPRQSRFTDYHPLDTKRVTCTHVDKRTAHKQYTHWLSRMSHCEIIPRGSILLTGFPSSSEPHRQTKCILQYANTVFLQWIKKLMFRIVQTHLLISPVFLVIHVWAMRIFSFPLSHTLSALRCLSVMYWFPWRWGIGTCLSVWPCWDWPQVFCVSCVKMFKVHEQVWQSDVIKMWKSKC